MNPIPGQHRIDKRETGLARNVANHVVQLQIHLVACPREPSQRGGLLTTAAAPLSYRVLVLSRRRRRADPGEPSNDRAWPRARFARVVGDRRRAERKASKTARPPVIAAVPCAPRAIARRRERLPLKYPATFWN